MMETNETANQRTSLKIWHLVVLFLVLSATIFMVGQNAGDFMASVISTKVAAPFDGTAPPILKVPKWTSLTSEQYRAAYDVIPAEKLVPLPKYDPAVLRTSTESLGWKTESDLNIRNSKITFSTPYMGNYKLDGVEYAGSHPAIDIKVPENTPIYSIANGIAVKVTDQASGFGKHIVIRHDNVPSYNDSSKKVTLYSSYSHLSELLVAQGDVVAKSQLLGKSGRTGTATTPHLHFQMDTADAPWYPYWPFTYQEANAAGYSFFEAVNAGLNADKAKAVTINPMFYVQKYAGATLPAQVDPGSSSSEPSSELPPAVTTVTDAVSTVPDPQAPATAITQEDTPPTTEVTAAQDPPRVEVPATRFLLETDGGFVVGAPKQVTIVAVGENGDIAFEYRPKDYVYFRVELGGADLPAYISADEFVDGKAVFRFTPLAENSIQIRITDGTIEGLSEIMKAETFGDIDAEARSYKAIGFLKKHGVIGGYPDGTFKPGNVVNRVEALKFILNASNSRLISHASLPFKDTKAGEWYTEYVATGYSKNIVAGYDDNSFKPENTVNRAEFLKMLVLAMDFRINPVVARDPYEDVPRDAWFAPYVRFAKEKNMVEAGGRKFRPEEGMTRVEVAETIYRAIMVKVTDNTPYKDGMAVSMDKVTLHFN